MIKKFFENTAAKVSLVFMIIVILAVAFLMRGFFIEQYHKLWGFYYVYQGDRQLKKMKLDRAIYYYDKALLNYPKHSKARCNLGNIYLLYENYTEAAACYEKALEYSPKFTVCRMDYGIVLAEKLSEYDEAIENYRKITKQRLPWIFIPYFYTLRKTERLNRGIAYYNMGLAYRDKAIKVGEYSLEATQYNMAAIEAYEKALKILKKDFDVRYNLALAHQFLKHDKEAGYNYCKAINIKPYNYEAHYNLAILLKKMGKYKYALGEFEKAALIANPNDDGSRLNYMMAIYNDTNQKLATLGEKGVKYAVERDRADSSAVEVVKYHHGKVVVSEQFNKSVLNDFKACESLELFSGDND